MSINKKKNVLIFGGGGYIGSHLTEKMKENANVIRLSERKLSSVEYANDLVVEFDNLNRHLEVFKTADVVYFLRSQTSAYKAEENPLEDFKLNLIPLISVLSILSKTKNNPKFIFTSTVTVYGLTPAQEKINEEYITNPITIYEVHKLLAEKVIIDYTKRGIIDGAIFRLANVYGPGIKSSTNDRGILNQLAKRAVNSEPITLFGDGNYLRDYIYIDDVINALSLTSEASFLNGEIFNLSSGESITLSDAVRIIKDMTKCLLNKDIQLNYIPEPASMLEIEKRNYNGDISKIKKILNWEPVIKINEGIENTIKSFIQKDK